MIRNGVTAEECAMCDPYLFIMPEEMFAYMNHELTALESGEKSPPQIWARVQLLAAGSSGDGPPR